MMRIFVLDKNRQPLDPCHPARARKLLKAGKAAIFRRYPYTIVLKDREFANSVVHLHRVKLDPGSRTTGIALLNEDMNTVVWGAEIEHRGTQIHLRMVARASQRRSRRDHHTRYRAPRFLNRNPEKCIVCGKNARHGHKTCRLHARVRPSAPVVTRRLPPSLESRVANVETWTKRLMRLTPVTNISMELVRFDLQQVESPEIQGVEYQQGTLAGYEVKEYLLLKFGHKCAYCGGLSNDPVFEVEHLFPRGRGGSDRVSNLANSCHTCNHEKGERTPEEWTVALANSTREIDRMRITNCGKVWAQAKAPLKDAAAVNATRWLVWQRLTALGLPIEVGSGGLTKFNRLNQGLPKEHWLDAACVGVSTPSTLHVESGTALHVTAQGYGRRQMQNHDKYGFPIGKPRSRQRHFHGFQTGDLVQIAVPNGKHTGVHVGRIAVRATGSFRVGVVDGIPWRYCHLIHRADGYAYAPSSPWLKPGASGAGSR